MSTRLSVNVNKVALLRNQRDVGNPSVVNAAKHIITSGAHGITVHPRPDQRHVRPTDVTDLNHLISDEFGGSVEFNIEGNPTEELLEIVHEARPDQVTLVPDEPDQRTSDHGWDLAEDGDRLAPIIGGLAAAGMRVSVFMDPDPGAMHLAAACGAHRIELYTESYATAFAARDWEQVLAGFVRGGRSRARARARCQCRPRSESRQSAVVSAQRARTRRGQYRPRIYRRCAGAWLQWRRCR